jgi:hypothetical protein
MSRVDTAPKPYCTMSWPGWALSSRIRPATSSAITVVFAQSGSLSVLETTYFGIVFMRSEIASPDLVCHTGANPSYVRRPISTASQAISRPVWICSPRPSDGRSTDGHLCGCSTTPSSEM